MNANVRHIVFYTRKVRGATARNAKVPANRRDRLAAYRSALTARCEAERGRPLW